MTEHAPIPGRNLRPARTRPIAAGRLYKVALYPPETGLSELRGDKAKARSEFHLDALSVMLVTHHHASTYRTENQKPLNKVMGGGA